MASEPRIMTIEVREVDGVVTATVTVDGVEFELDGVTAEMSGHNRMVPFPNNRKGDDKPRLPGRFDLRGILKRI